MILEAAIILNEAFVAISVRGHPGGDLSAKLEMVGFGAIQLVRERAKEAVAIAQSIV